jgi:uroporphyrinogen decarboxylase
VSDISSLQRVLTTIGHKEPDRVPLFLFATMHGAKHLGLSIREYFSKPEYVVEGQLGMLAKYSNDCVSAFFYAAIEIEAWGGEVMFYEDGPPNAAGPIIRKPYNIKDLEPPDVKNSSPLAKVLKATAMIKAKVRNDTPIVGVVMSPFSVPVMQLGFDNYIELIYEQPDVFNDLMKINEEFCVNWANAQLEAGASVIGYFDPVSSTTIIPRDLYLKTGFKVAKRTLAKIKGPTATHMASGRCLPIIEDIAKTGTVVIGVSYDEDLVALKEASRDKLTVMGNLNGIAMRHWTPEQAETFVKNAIAKAGPGGGFILSDNHGEIPWQVPEEILLAISDAVQKWGRYPLDWAREYGK